MGRLYDDLSFLWPLVSPPEDYQEEVGTFVDRFRRYGENIRTILHLGCGAGSVDHHLRTHFQVTGVDRSPAMLAIARQLNPDVEYLQGDMRTVRLDRLFDGVLIHDAISYCTTVEDLERTYRRAWEHLRPGGVAVSLVETLDTQYDPDVPTLETHSDGRVTLQTLEVVYDPDPDDHQFENTFVYLIRENGHLRVEHDVHLCGVHSLHDFTSAMRRAGFQVEVTEWELPDLDGYPLLVGTKEKGEA